MKKRNGIAAALFSVLMILVAGLSACTPRETPTPEPPTSTPTPEVSPTPTLAPERIVLYDPQAQAGELLSSMMNEFANVNGIGFENWTALSDLRGVKVIVLYATVDNLAEVAASAPQTQFLDVISSTPSAGNISILAANPTHLAFMAGYLAAMTSTEWRAGALLSDDTNLGLADAFYNGGQYLCGRCTPKYGPILYYPQVYTESGTADATAWTALAQSLWNDTNANSVYIDPAGDFTPVLDMFAEEYVFTANPASSNLARYTAVLGPDAPAGIQLALPDLLAGNGGKVFTSPVTLAVINNADVISPAKQTLFNEVSAKLAAGQINPLSVP
jgi:hypothetical protein